jgi:ATP-binding cassette subfamily B multidrug efflux pump
MSSVSGKAFDLKLFRRVLSYAKPYKGLFILSLVLTVIRGVLVPIRIILMADMVGDYVQGADKQGPLNELFVKAAVLLGLLVLEAVLQFVITYMSNIIGQNVIRDLRIQLFKKITEFRLKYFDQNPIGRLVTRAVSDIETVADVFSQGILTITADLLTLIVVMLAMIWYDWQFAIAALLPIPIVVWATSIFKKKIKSAFTDVRTEVSNLNTYTQEHITGMKIVQIFNREKKEAETFNEINKRHRKAHIKSVWAFSVFLPVVEIIGALSLGLIILFTIFKVGNGVTDARVLAQSFTAFVLFNASMYRPIRMLADRFNTLQMGMVGSDRVFKVLDTESYVVNTNRISSATFDGAINFKNVQFAYNEPEWVLKDVSFEVKAGETVAFVGATGAGKTSIISLLSRFYEFQKGDILIDGESIRDYSLEAIRENIALVLQDVFLFSDSIINNITLNNPKISRQEVIDAAKHVGAHDFIMRLPGNYDFDVKERGGTLSVGQRQLISFIRAYVYKPKLLILDEATSSIDTESELIIQKAIEKLTENCTSIVIAHRLSTIQKSDRIIVLDKGEIVEQGNHHELLKLEQGYYKKLHDLQYKEVTYS